MTNNELDKILKQGESYTIEFKRNANKEIKNEICSFLNSSGGKVLIGIDDNNTVCGVEVNNNMRSNLQTSIEAIIPRPQVEIEEINYEGKQIIVINCISDDRKPYMVSGSIYIRVGANSQKLISPDEVRDFFQEENKIFFEKAVNKSFKYPSDFDIEKFDGFLTKTGISKPTPQKQVLENLNLISEKGELINAGILFFAKKVEMFFEYASIRCLLFKGTNKSLILDDKLISGSLIEQYEKAMQFLKSKIELRYIIKTDGPRIEKYEIPEVVFKEAVINALVHRDYYETGGKIHIEIYDDRIEITNPGGLVKTIKEKEFGKRSVSRNPLIFNLFQRLNMVEQVGSGISRMYDEMKAEDLPAPQFSLKGFFAVTLYRPANFDKWIANWKDKLTKNQLEILIRINKNNNITQSELSDIIGISKTTVYYNINKLKELSLLERVGSDKSGYWTIYYKNDNQIDM